MKSQSRKGKWQKWVLGFLAFDLLVISALLLLGFKWVGVHSDTSPHAVDPFHSAAYANVLSCVVGHSFDYDCGRRQRHELDQVLRAAAQPGALATPSDHPDDAKEMAFLINAYNAWTIYLVLEQEHLPKSVTEVHGPLEVTTGFGFFFAHLFPVNGAPTNLYFLEKRLRESGDPRIHAAINCASRSCPPLAPSAYQEETLDKELDKGMRNFACASSHIKKNNVQTSMIFSWYEDEFEEEAGSVSAYLHRYCEQVPPHSAINFRTYDWSLNRVRKK